MPPSQPPPWDGGGAAAPSPPAGRVGVGAMFKSHCKGIYNRTGRVYQLPPSLYQLRRQSSQLPPSCRFPPLREGNREKRARSVPPAGRGNLKEGVFSRACFHKLCPRGWYNAARRARRLINTRRIPRRPPRFARPTTARDLPPTHVQCRHQTVHQSKYRLHRCLLLCPLRGCFFPLP